MAGLAGASPDCGSEEALIQPHTFKAEQRLTSVLGTRNNRTLSVCCLVVGVFLMIPSSVFAWVRRRAVGSRLSRAACGALQSPHLSAVLGIPCRAGREILPGASRGSGEESCACPVRGESRRGSGRRRSGEVGEGEVLPGWQGHCSSLREGMRRAKMGLQFGERSGTSV